jgi:hypothetical protein
MSDASISEQWSDEITWGELKKFVDSHEGVTDNTKIDSIRLKSSHNKIGLILDQDEIVIND